MIDVLLRGEFDNDRYGARREGVNLPAPLTLSAGPVADAPPPTTASTSWYLTGGDLVR
jgi:hypothetical protein